MIELYEPWLVTVAFPCSGHSQMQAINEARGYFRTEEQAIEDKLFVQFTADILRLQREGDRLGLAENRGHRGHSRRGRSTTSSVTATPL